MKKLKTKECPSCAFDVETKAKVCPICGHEFRSYSKWIQIVAITLLILMVVYFLFT